MQVHFSGIELVGDNARFRVDSDAYCGEMTFFQGGGANGGGRVVFNPLAPDWFGQKVSERIFQLPAIEKDFALFINPPNAM